MPQTRSLTITKTVPANMTDTVLITTSQNSWGHSDFGFLQSNQLPPFDQSKDIAGPLTIAVSGENTTTQSHVVVFGNSLFVTDKGFDAYANGDIFINSVDWVAKQSNLINITPRTPISRTFNAPAQIPFIIILLSSVILIPGLIVAAGFSSWLARRRQG
jgi:ABC-type uncharacterized transport system involved in gliding motility auxiliary subunit